MNNILLKSVLTLAMCGFLTNSEVFAQEMDHSTMVHEAEERPVPEPEPEQKTDVTDHSTMDHSKMNHSSMNMDTPMAPVEPITPIPALADADRLAAFPKVNAHAMHGDSAMYGMFLIDQLEAWDASPSAGLAWDVVAWRGSDTNRVWLRTEGERIDSRLESAELEVFAGRSVAPWWDVLVGVRHDFKPGQAQDFLAIGVMGLSPYKFESDATAYIGEGGQTAVRIQFEYETLLTNRLILQPKLEVNFYGKDDLTRAIGSGLSDAGFGLRLRYEVTRQFAPYIGVSWEKSYRRTADYLRQNGEFTEDFNVVAGIRIWF